MQPRSCINKQNLKGCKKISSYQIRGLRKKINQKMTKSYLTSLSTLVRAIIILSGITPAYVKKEGGKISENKSKAGKIRGSVLNINKRTVSLSK